MTASTSLFDLRPQSPLMEIRIATVNDFDSIVEIYLAAPPSSAALGAVVARSRYFESPGKDVFVVLDETPRVVGYASVIRQAQDLPLIPSELEEIRIAPPSQHRGYGTALLEWMRSTNQCDTWVRCQRNDERAIAWFKKQGYEYRRTEFSETGVLTVLMRPGQMCVRRWLLRKHANRSQHPSGCSAVRSTGHARSLCR